MRRPVVAFVAAISFLATLAQAHVVVTPRDSMAGATESYTMRVPTEGTVATTSVELIVPDGVTILSIEGPPGSFDATEAGDRIVRIMWKTSIPPGESQGFAFLARNPETGGEIAWKARQHFADGTSVEWFEAAAGRRPASLTKLTAAPP